MSDRHPAGPIVLDDRLSLADLEALATGRSRLALGANALGRLKAARAALHATIAEGRLVYGVTTGFGPLADRLIGADESRSLQRKLVYHLASGVGPALPFAQARACAVARLAALCAGWSGASEALIAALVALINSDLAPLIPEKGTVGASGDLTPLSHLALALMGEGGFIDRDGRAVETAAAFRRLAVAPIALDERDGLALVNGASAMTGIAALNAGAARRLFAWAGALTVGVGEALRGRAEAWDAQLGLARPHPGQIAAAALLRARAAGSARLEFTPAAAESAERLGASAGAALGRPLQDAYSLRTAPQVLGAALDALAFHDRVAVIELNAATDNPIFTQTPPHAVHGGNFQGVHVALASDSLKAATLVVAGLVERQIARVTDEKKNGGLPAFLTGGRAGLDSGLMGAQVTATALLAEMRISSAPASAHSISTNGDNQDVVSLGTIAARQTAAALDDLARLTAIESLCVAQCLDIAGPPESYSPATRALVDWVRERSGPLPEDRPLGFEIEALSHEIATLWPPGGGIESLTNSS